MEEETAPVNQHAPIRHAAEKVLEDDLFARAPVMAHLLGYLVDRTIAGEPVKSYTIAIEALGKSEGDLADADTYARVAVARLRKTLTSYYAKHPGTDEIYIDTGSYQVRVRKGVRDGRDAVASPIEPSAQLRGLPSRLSLRAYRLIAVGLVILALALAVITYHADGAAERWETSDYPTMAIVQRDEGEIAGQAAADLEYFRNTLRDRLLEHIGFRLVEPGPVRADYEISLDFSLRDDAEVATVVLVDTATRRVIWTQQYSSFDDADLARNASRVATAIAAPEGALNEYAQRLRLGTRTPYGCWLRFTETVKSYSSRGDRELYDCAEDWNAANPTSDSAAFLRNWTIVDASITRLDRSAQREDLEEALAVVHGALARSPDQAMLYIAEMRTYAFLGDREGVRHAATSALACAPDNRVIKGMVGTWLAFWNDPQGAEILAGLDQGSDPSPSWEHAGCFVAAMMRDDLRDTARHLVQLRIDMDGQPALYLLEAAHAARAGRPQAAEVALERLRNHPSTLIVGQDDIIERLPFAPEVKARLRAWIAYRPAAAASE